MPNLQNWIGSMPDKGGEYDKKVLDAIHSVRIGDKVALRWIFEGRRRVLDLAKIDAPK